MTRVKKNDVVCVICSDFKLIGQVTYINSSSKFSVGSISTIVENDSGTTLQYHGINDVVEIRINNKKDIKVFKREVLLTFMLENIYNFLYDSDNDIPEKLYLSRMSEIKKSSIYFIHSIVFHIKEKVLRKLRLDSQYSLRKRKEIRLPEIEKTLTLIIEYGKKHRRKKSGSITKHERSSTKEVRKM